MHERDCIEQRRVPGQPFVEPDPRLLARSLGPAVPLRSGRRDKGDNIDPVAEPVRPAPGNPTTGEEASEIAHEPAGSERSDRPATLPPWCPRAGKRVRPFTT